MPEDHSATAHHSVAPDHRAPTGPTPRRRVLAQFGLAGVGLTAGMLFAVTGRLDRSRGTGRTVTSPRELLEAREDRIDVLTEDAARKRAELERLREEAGGSDPDTDPAPGANVQRRVGLTAVTGPALRVSLTDAPPSAAVREGITPDDLVVHQQDLEGYINALWAGSAEAMMLQDQRVVFDSAFRCVGNTLLLEGRVYSPPFTVTAIGDVPAMRRSLDASPSVIGYRQWVDAVGLGENIEELPAASLPAFDGSLTLTHAEVPGE